MTGCNTVQADFSAVFHFCGGLEKLLVRRYQKHPVIYNFNESPGIKDAIEAMGIPHTEVDVILVNEESVAFKYRLKNKDRVFIYPVHVDIPFKNPQYLSPQITSAAKFVIDVHLGSLTRRLRLLGFDCIYRNDIEDADILDISTKSNRIILTRDLGILKHRHVNYGYLVRSEYVEQQVVEVLSRYCLFDHINVFSRCIACNGIIEPVDKLTVYDRLEPKTRLYYEEFHRCAECDRIYWRGSHFKKIQVWLDALLSQTIPVW